MPVNFCVWQVQLAKDPWYHAAVFDADKGWFFDNDKDTNIIKLINVGGHTKGYAKNVFKQLMGHKNCKFMCIYNISKASLLKFLDLSKNMRSYRGV